MNKIDIFDFFVDEFSLHWRSLIFQGILFLLFGIFVIYFPKILAYLIASFFMILGIIMVYFALLIRRFKKRYYRVIRDDLFELF